MRTLSDHDAAQVAADLQRAGAADLFNQPPAQRHSPTSIAAAESVKGRVSNMRGLVLEVLRDGPLTDEQIAQVSGLSPNTARPRRVELVDAGLVVKAGISRTKSGRKAVAWGLPSTR